jgi:dihydrofolate synthase / folylpolyglutamate synthase
VDEFSTLNEAVEYLYSLRRIGIKLDLLPIIKALKSLGDPQNSYRTVHIGGTNGKGSCGAVVERLLREMGHKTGLFTSPHLIRFSERIRVNGEEISQTDFIALINRLKSINLSFFETATAMAHIHFHNSGVNAAVIEVGLGGRLDSTNHGNPGVSIIASIGNDHAYSLGTFQQKISWEKAGIIKAGVPLVIPNLSPGIRYELEKAAISRGAPLFIDGLDFHLQKNPKGKLLFSFKDDPPIEVIQILKGKKQLSILSLSLAACRIFSNKPLDAAIAKKATSDLKWPGRFEQIENFILDGAHNSAASIELAKTIEDLHETPMDIILGMMADKDAAEFIKPLLPIAKSFYPVVVPSDRSMSSKDLSALIISMGGKVQSAPRNISSLLKTWPKNRKALLTGSFYLTGQARSLLLYLKGDSLPLTDPSQ